MKSSERLIAAGKFTSRGDWIHPDVTVGTTEIIVVTDGKVMIEEAGVNYCLSSGDVLILAPNIRHSGYEYSREKTSFYWVHINGLHNTSETISQKHFSLREPHHVSLLCRQLLHYSKTIGSEEAADHILSVLLHELYVQSLPENDSTNALAHRIVEWIRINSDRNITACDVADKFGYNEDYISRLLKKYCGAGLKAQIDIHKNGLVESLLLETELSLSEISDTAGFADYKLFLKYFKYHFGMTPSEFRRAYYAVHTNNR